ncbi:hypothetical protein VTL71DRAFT_14692 [Oculimacula yallundae]|uniref:Catalase n=1 Tax=Oculimacula yallundae TaxID=86028 RepID=A0ABR4CJ70_9HELO
MGSIGTSSSDQTRTYQGDREAKSQDTIYTASNGAPVPHPYEAQRAGENGPLLLQDFHLIDLLSHFDRERIPERVVHAKGSGAHGVYRTTNTLDDLCLADIFQPSKECPITVRFSTVGGESGSHDCARDPRGFSVKFRTDEGNWDVVANNTPVFFLRDPAKFPYFIHTQKRHPSTHLTHADDSTVFWDYLSQNPESIHQVMILFGDRGIPDGYRTMHGYLGHSVKLINKNGEWVYCQIHFKSQQGPVKFITQEDSASYSPDYSQKDLYEAIEKGDFPKWNVEVQTMTPKQAEELWETEKINVFDLTHVWPHSKFPLRKVGEFELNENAANYFAEIEQVAFNPAHMVPGIEPSADPVLQSRLFSYPDAHRHRVGVNYQQLPVNAPRVPYKMANFQRDGQMAFLNQGSRPNYLSSIQPIGFKDRKVNLDHTHAHFASNAVSFLSEIRAEDFNAPRNLWEKVFDAKAKERFISNISGHMANCTEDEIIKRQISIFREVSEDLASRLEKATGIKGYDGIKDLKFNGTHNGLASKEANRVANGMGDKGVQLSRVEANGAPVKGTHSSKIVANGQANGSNGTNGIH